MSEKPLFPGQAAPAHRHKSLECVPESVTQDRHVSEAGVLLSHVVLTHLHEQPGLGGCRRTSGALWCFEGLFSPCTGISHPWEAGESPCYGQGSSTAKLSPLHSVESQELRLH